MANVDSELERAQDAERQLETQIGQMNDFIFRKCKRFKFFVQMAFQISCSCGSKTLAQAGNATEASEIKQNFACDNCIEQYDIPF